jgi:hypothetical protein
VKTFEIKERRFAHGKETPKTVETRDSSRGFNLRKKKIEQKFKRLPL